MSEEQQPAASASGDKEAVRREARFVEIGKLEGPDKEERLRDLYDIWRKPISDGGKKQTLRKDEIQELLDYKIILPMAAVVADSIPQQAGVDICDSQSELAKRMNLHFQNPDKTSKLRYEITKSKITSWHQGKGLPASSKTFPKLEGTRKRYSLRDTLDWFMETLWGSYRKDGVETSDAETSSRMSLPELKDITERERLEKERFDIQVEMGGYIATKKAAAIIGGTMRQYHDFLKGRLESMSPEAFEVFWQGIGQTPEQISASKEFLITELRKVIDDLESEAANRSKDNSDRIESQVKHDLGQ